MSFYCCITRVAQEKMINISQCCKYLLPNLKEILKNVNLLIKIYFFLFNCDNGELGIKFTLIIETFLNAVQTC